MSVYALADLHGRMDLFKLVKDFLKEEDICYVLGDCADRGDHGWEIIKEVYNDPRFIYLKGNHEDMLVKAMREFLTYDQNDPDDLNFFYNYCYEFKLVHYNGGKKTFMDWRKDKDHRNQWILILEKLPISARYVNENKQEILLSHAGFTPGNPCLNAKDLLWDRSHMIDSWEAWDTEQYPDAIVVHGHTPIPYMEEEMYPIKEHEVEIQPGAFWYCEDDEGIPRKVNIDCGAVFTGSTVLLNLDTWEEEIFFAEETVYEV